MREAMATYRGSTDAAAAAATAATASSAVGAAVGVGVVLVVLVVVVVGSLLKEGVFVVPVAFGMVVEEWKG